LHDQFRVGGFPSTEDGKHHSTQWEAAVSERWATQTREVVKNYIQFRPSCGGGQAGDTRSGNWKRLRGDWCIGNFVNNGNVCYLEFRMDVLNFTAPDPLALESPSAEPNSGAAHHLLQFPPSL